MEGDKPCSTLAIENSNVLRKAANRQWDEYLKLSRQRGSDWQAALYSMLVLQNWRRAMMYQSFEYSDLEKAAWLREREEMFRKAGLS